MEWNGVSLLTIYMLLTMWIIMCITLETLDIVGFSLWISLWITNGVDFVDNMEKF
jgi:hypothetical protein